MRLLLLLLMLVEFEASVISALLLLLLPGQMMPSRAAYSAMVSVDSAIAEGWARVLQPAGGEASSLVVMRLRG